MLRSVRPFLKSVCSMFLALNGALTLTGNVGILQFLF